METGTEVDDLRTWTVQQLSEATGVQTWRIYQLIAQGKGPRHFRVGLVIRFRVTDVRQWMDEQTTNQKEA